MGEWIDSEEILFQSDKGMEMSIKFMLADIIGALYKTHKPLCKNLLEISLTQIINNAFSQKGNHDLTKLGIFMIDDIVEFLDKDFVGNRWDTLVKTLFQYSLSTHCPIRQASVYGVGVIAEKTPTNQYTK